MTSSCVLIDTLLIKKKHKQLGAQILTLAYSAKESSDRSLYIDSDQVTMLLANERTELILGLCPASERRCYFATTALIGWAQAWNQPWEKTSPSALNPPSLTGTKLVWTEMTDRKWVQGPLLLEWFNFSLIPAWISNHMPGKVWNEITYPFLNFNGCTVEV